MLSSDQLDLPEVHFMQIEGFVHKVNPREVSPFELMRLYKHADNMSDALEKV